MRDLNRVSGQWRTVQSVEHVIVHHEGALAMSEKVLTLDGIRAETRALAEAVIRAQNEEIAWMRDRLQRGGR